MLQRITKSLQDKDKQLQDYVHLIQEQQVSHCRMRTQLQDYVHLIQEQQVSHYRMRTQLQDYVWDEDTAAGLCAG